MRRRALDRKLLRTLSGAILLAYVPACTSWHALPATAPAPTPDKPRTLRITLRDGSKLELLEAFVLGDSLVGEQIYRYRRFRTAVPVGQIHATEERRVNVGQTVALVVGVVGIAAVIGIIALAEALKNYCPLGQC